MCKTAFVPIHNFIIFLPLRKLLVEDLYALLNIRCKHVAKTQYPENVAYDVTCNAQVDAMQDIDHNYFQTRSATCGEQHQDSSWFEKLAM